MTGKRFVRRQSAGRPMRVIGVAGTSGKTTTAWLTAAVLAEAGLNVGVLSDLGCLGPDDPQPVAVPYASPERFARWLGRLAAAGCSHAVVEIPRGMPASSLPVELTFDTVIVTNLAGRGGRGADRSSSSPSSPSTQPMSCAMP